VSENRRGYRGDEVQIFTVSLDGANGYLRRFKSNYPLGAATRKFKGFLYTPVDEGFNQHIASSHGTIQAQYGNSLGTFQCER
jgi:hypothetical protein